MIPLRKMRFIPLTPESILKKLTTNLQKNPKKSPAIEESALGFLIKTMVAKKDEQDYEVQAVKAYQSFLRSYATHVKATKHIFHLKNLHLGHVAKSFGLSLVPTSFASLLPKEEPQGAKPKPLKNKINPSAEFDSGMGFKRDH